MVDYKLEDFEEGLKEKYGTENSTYGGFIGGGGNPPGEITLENFSEIVEGRKSIRDGEYRKILEGKAEVDAANAIDEASNRERERERKLEKNINFNLKARKEFEKELKN